MVYMVRLRYIIYGEKWKFTDAGQRQGKIGLLSQWTVGRLSFAIEVTAAENSEI